MWCRTLKDSAKYRVVLHVSVERQRLKHLQSLMVVGMEDASCHVGFPASVGGKWQSVVSTW